MIDRLHYLGASLGGGSKDRSPSEQGGGGFKDPSYSRSQHDGSPDSNFEHQNKAPSKMSDRSGPSPIGNTHSSLYNMGNNGNGAGTRTYKSNYGQDERAYLVQRSLDVGGSKHHVPNMFLLPDTTSHWAIKFPDGKYVGYYDDNRVHSDDASHASWYKALTIGNKEVSLNANLAAKAVNNMLPQWDGSEYKVIPHSCQNFVSDVVSEYKREGGTIKYESSNWYSNIE